MYLSCLHSLRSASVRSFSSKLSRGDVVLYQGKFEGEKGDVLHSKRRPHIVVSSNKVLEVTKRVVLAPLSTTPARFEFEVMIPSHARTGIDKDSKVVANQIRTGFLDERFNKIGSVADFLPQIDEALAISFGEFGAPTKEGIKRGDVVEIDFKHFMRNGIIISNDLGNHYSQIAMLAHAHHKGEAMNEFDLLVRREEGSQNQGQLLVQCYMINTFAQKFMKKAGRVPTEDMNKVTRMLFRTLGISETN